MFIFFFLYFFLVQSPLFAASPSLVISSHWEIVRITQKKNNWEIDHKKGKPFPFYQYKIFDDHRLGLYALRSSRGVANQYYHYFEQKGKQFYYLGNHPLLSYDEQLKLFFAMEKDGGSHHISFYHLEQHKFHQVKILHLKATTSKETAEHFSLGDRVSLSQEGEYFKQVVSCTLGKIYPEITPHMKRIRTLNFITEQFVKNIKTYNVDSDIEKSHLLAQIIYESAGLSSTVERTRSSYWKSLLADNKSDQWSCGAYLHAIEYDRHFFNHDYIYSSGSYKAAFRGRGLIQLTGCANYLGFFYHKAAISSGKEELALKMKRDFFYKDDNGAEVAVGMFCTPEVLQTMAQQFQSEGLTLRPEELLSDFETTVNHLALPCQEGESDQAPITRQEFIVDSSLWYWKKCQNEYADFVDNHSDQAVAKMSICVHGSKKYNQYNSSLCEGGISNDAHWTLGSYCGRLKAFHSLRSCFSEQSF